MPRCAAQIKLKIAREAELSVRHIVKSSPDWGLNGALHTVRKIHASPRHCYAIFFRHTDSMSRQRRRTNLLDALARSILHRANDRPSGTRPADKRDG
jgi:hypothetical protein